MSEEKTVDECCPVCGVELSNGTCPRGHGALMQVWHHFGKGTDDQIRLAKQQATIDRLTAKAEGLVEDVRELVEAEKTVMRMFDAAPREVTLWTNATCIEVAIRRHQALARVEGRMK